MVLVATELNVLFSIQRVDVMYSKYINMCEKEIFERTFVEILYYPAPNP